MRWFASRIFGFVLMLFTPPLLWAQDSNQRHCTQRWELAYCNNPFPHATYDYYFDLSGSYQFTPNSGTSNSQAHSYRLSAHVGHEFLQRFSLEALLSLPRYRTGDFDYEVGGGVRFQDKVYWRFVPILSGDVGYSSFADNLFVRADVGMNLKLLRINAAQLHHLLFIPGIGYQYDFVPGDNMQNLLLTFTFMIVNHWPAPHEP